MVSSASRASSDPAACSALERLELRADGVGLLLQLALQREIDVGFASSISVSSAPSVARLRSA